MYIQHGHNKECYMLYHKLHGNKYIIWACDKTISHYYTCSLSTKYVGCFFVVEDFAAVYNIIFKIIILSMSACFAPLYVLYVSVSNVAERASNTQTT